MADAGPDYIWETMRLERQRKQIEVTMLDQLAQVESGKEELSALKAERKKREANMPELLEKGTPAEVARRAHDVGQAELALMDIDLRIREIQGEAEQKHVNIDASRRAIVELDAQIEQMKEAHGG